MTTTLPIIELRAIKVDQRLSQETYAYSAKLFADGAHICDVGNDGHGGADRYLGPGKGLDYRASQQRYDEISRLVAISFPQQDLADPGETPNMVEDSLEYLCARLVSDHLIAKSLARDIKRNVLFFADGLPPQGSCAPLRMVRLDSDAGALATRIKAKYAAAYVLNEQTPDQALEAYKRAA